MTKLTQIQGFFENKTAPTHSVLSADNSPYGVVLDVRREDLLHAELSGNKFRKLHYNLIEAAKAKATTLLTFGGAYSNHIAAVAMAGRIFGFETVGVIRGDELAHKKRNPTLSRAMEYGMKLHFVTRDMYRQKETAFVLEKLTDTFGPFYVLPEGGTNALAVKGTEEILTSEDDGYDYICLAVGTGGTMAGVINSSKEHQKVLGFSVLKGAFQEELIRKYSGKNNFEITDSYAFNGYGKIDSDLVRFINEFKSQYSIPLDPVYTSKLMYGVMDLLKKGYFKENSRILAVHSGGLQGIAGYNGLLLKKGLPLIY